MGRLLLPFKSRTRRRRPYGMYAGSTACQARRSTGPPRCRPPRFLHHSAGAHVPAVAFLAQTPTGLSHVSGLRTRMASRPRASIFRAIFVRDDLVLVNDHLVGDRVTDVVTGGAADDQLRQRDIDLVAAADAGLGDAVQRAAIRHVMITYLGHVDELAGRGYRQLAVSKAVSASPLRAPWVELKYSSTGQALAEVRLDGRLDDLAARACAIRPRMPASWLNLVDAAAAPESVIRWIGVQREIFQSSLVDRPFTPQIITPSFDDRLLAWAPIPGSITWSAPLALGENAFVVVLWFLPRSDRLSVPR